MLRKIRQKNRIRRKRALLQYKLNKEYPNDIFIIRIDSYLVTNVGNIQFNIFKKIYEKDFSNYEKLKNIYQNKKTQNKQAYAYVFFKSVNFYNI